MVHDHTSDDPQPDQTPVIWLFVGAGVIAAIIELTKYILKILEK